MPLSSKYFVDKERILLNGGDSIESIHDDWPEGVIGYISKFIYHGLCGGCSELMSFPAVGINPEKKIVVPV